MECMEKDESFKEKQALRAEELQALAKAIDILSSEDVQAAGAKHLSFSQVPNDKHAAALVQVLGGGRGGSKADIAGIRRTIGQFLAQKGQQLHSKRLGLLAEKLSEDPFAKVKSGAPSLARAVTGRRGQTLTEPVAVKVDDFSSFSTSPYTAGSACRNDSGPWST